MPPALRDRYLLGERLGSGGMADVHRASDTTLQRTVAVKILRDTAGDASDRARFVREARTLASLSHRNLVMVLDAGIGDEDDRPFLVMELVEGRSLSEALAGGALPAQEVARIGGQLAAGLAYAHDRGVVHRDVKPANVLLSDEGRVKLADFGIARLIGDTVRHTRTGTAIGTAAYLSPEQVRGEDVTGAADVYALGLVLLEALTGTRAFPGSATEAALARLHRDPDVPADLPGGWAALLTAMTAAEPGSRPTAAAAAGVLSAGVPAPEQRDSADPSDRAGSTALLTAPVATAVTPLPATPAAAPGAAAAVSAPTPHLDRAGDALARVPGRVRRRWSSLAPHERGVAGAIAAIVVLLCVAGLAAGGSTGPGGTPGGPTPPVEAPQDLSPLPVGGGLGSSDGQDGPASEPAPAEETVDEGDETDADADQERKEEEKARRELQKELEKERRERIKELREEAREDDDD